MRAWEWGALCFLVSRNNALRLHDGFDLSTTLHVPLRNGFVRCFTSVYFCCFVMNVPVRNN